MVGHTPQSHKNEVSQLLGTDSLVPQQRDGSYRDGLEEADKSNNLGNEMVTLSSEKDQFMWVNDYKCSLCGIELPPSFIEERQEHVDFHIAERLQKEESNSNLRMLTPRQRYFTFLVSSLLTDLSSLNMLKPKGYA